MPIEKPPYPGSMKLHGEYVALNDQKSYFAILQVMCTKGGQYFPVALKLFQAKILAQLM